MPAILSANFYFYTACLVLCSGIFWKRDRQNAILEARLNLVGVDLGIQRNGSLKTAITTFGVGAAAVFFLIFGAFLAADRNRVVAQIDLDIFLLEAGQFSGDVICLIGFVQVNARP